MCYSNNIMTGISEFKHLFPIESIQKVYDLFEEQLRSENEPDLALFSIIVGAVENNLTNIKSGDRDVHLQSNRFVKVKFPCVEWEEVSELHERFVTLMRNGVDAKLLAGEYATRELVKRVADVVWNSLTRSYYKDRAHLQSIYSFLTGNKLDCFGVAFAVTAGCQVLGKKDVHLALSEDHAWVVFGKDGSQTAEVRICIIIIILSPLSIFPFVLILGHLYKMLQKYSFSILCYDILGRI